MYCLVAWEIWGEIVKEDVIEEGWIKVPILQRHHHHTYHPRLHYLHLDMTLTQIHQDLTQPHISAININNPYKQHNEEIKAAA